MDRAAKQQVLGEIKEAFQNVASVVIADYRGITVPVVTAMRDDFRKNGCQYRVIKNSLVKIMGGYYEGSVLDAAGVDALSKMPGKNEIRASMLMTFLAAPQGFVAQLN